MSGQPSWSWFRSQLSSALDEFAASFDGLDGSSLVPGLDWTVAELAAHVACLPGGYRRQHELGSDFVPPADFAPFSVAQRAHIDTSDLAEVVELLRAEFGSFIDDLEGLDLEQERWAYGQPITYRHQAALFLNELIVHGRDLTPLSGRRPEHTREQANEIVPATLALLPAFVDPAKAARAAGVYGLRFRGGGDFTNRITPAGDVSVEAGRPELADARLLADPVTFILVSLGRVNPMRAALTGRMIVYGRRPWRFLATADITRPGV